MLKRNLIANYLGQGWTALMGLAFIPLYIKYLGIEAYGVIGLFALLQAWLALLDMGMTPTLSREMARYTGGSHTVVSIRDLLRSIEVTAFGIAMLIAVGIALGADWLAGSWLKAEKLPVREVSQAFALMGLVTALRFVEGVYRSSIVGLQRQVLLNVVGSSMATLRGLGAVAILTLVAPTIQAFFIWQGVVSVVTLVVLGGATYASLPRAERPGRFSWESLCNIWRFAGGMIGITFLGLLLTQVDKILLSKLLTLSDYGYYTLAAVVASAIYIVVAPIAQAWFPRLSQLHSTGSREELARTFHQGAQMVSVAVGSAALVLLVFAESLLRLWTQDAILAHRTAPLLRLLVLGNLLNCLMWLPYQTQLAHGWTSLTVRINIVSVLIIVPAIFWATPRYGTLGAAWIWVILNAGYVLIGAHFMYRKILASEKWNWYLDDIGKPICSILVVLGALKFALPEPITVMGNLLQIAISCIGAVVIAGLTADLVRRKLIDFARLNIMNY